MNTGTKDLEIPALVAGPNIAYLHGVPEGHLETVRVKFKGTGKSTGVTFNSSVPSGGNVAARNVDDLDIVLAALITSLGFSVDGSKKNIDGIDPRVIRSWLMKEFHRDVGVSGILADGAAVPASGGASGSFEIDFDLPVSLLACFADGDQFAMGTDIARKGYVQAKMIALGGVNPVLKNGTLAIDAASVTWAITGYSDTAGDPADVAPTWELDYTTGIDPEARPVMSSRLSLTADDCQGAAATSNYTIKGKQSVDDSAPASINAGWAKNHKSPETCPLATNRGTALYWHPRDQPLSSLDVAPSAPLVTRKDGAAQAWLDFRIMAPNPKHLQAVASTRAEGGTGNISLVKTPPRHGRTSLNEAQQKFVRVQVRTGHVQVPNAKVLHTTAREIR